MMMKIKTMRDGMTILLSDSASCKMEGMDAFKQKEKWIILEHNQL